MNKINRNLAIISPLKPTYSETFIKAHLDLLPCKTHLFYSLKDMGYHPIYNPQDEPLSSDYKIINYLETAVERLTSPQVGYYVRKKAFRKYLRDNDIHAVMAEYGPSGYMVMEDCKELNIPLIVHFHGRDAYHYATIKKYGNHYKRMFSIAKKVIAVSNEMKEQLVSLGCPSDTISILEAMLAGLPVVSTRHAGIKDIIVENESGLLVDEQDWEGMSNHIQWLIANKKEGAKIGSVASERVKKNFTMDHHLQAVWDTISSCMN